MPDSYRNLRVFLCHAAQDKPTVRELYKQLSAEGWMDVWLDEVKLLPGQEWDIEMRKQLSKPMLLLFAFLISPWIKRGMFKKELRFV